MKRPKLAVLIAVRQWSDRLQGKALVDICGRPLLAHLLDRFRLDSDRVTDVVVATSNKPEDDGIADLCEREETICYRSPASSEGDVTRLLDEALEAYAPDADYVLRGMGDCPFLEAPIICDWMTDVLTKRNADVVWVGLPDEPWPIYGARESPWSRHTWDECAARSSGSQMLHPGAYIYDHLQDYHVVHTQPLREEYYRPYRLELDTPDDLRVVRAIYEGLWTGPGHIISMLDAIRWLDANPEVAVINAEVELKSITLPDWRRRGIKWACQECGSNRMYAEAIRRGALVTVCDRCGERRRFVETKEYQR